MALRMKKETDCKDCVYPRAKPTAKARQTTDLCQHHQHPFEGVARQTLVIRGHGTVPIAHGDVAWVPDRAKDFICDMVTLMKPSNVYLCNGSVFEEENLKNILISSGTTERLTNYPDVLNTRTDPVDTARVEKNTYICTTKRKDVESSRKDNYESDLARWISPTALSIELNSRFPGCMRGRTMFVIPFSMGPIAHKNSKVALQVTDSPYVALNMIMVTRVNSCIWDLMHSGDFIKCVHSIGAPRPHVKPTVRNWACNFSRVLVAHHLDNNEIWSYGSGYGGNCLLGKKCISLRLGSYFGFKEGWLAEHAAILSITDPSGKEEFICVSFPSGGGKTVMSFMAPSLPGWKVEVLADDIAWIRPGKDGRLYAMAPEYGMFGIAADTKLDTGKHIVDMLAKKALLVNAASTSKGKFFWNGLEATLQKDEKITDWKGKPWKVGDKTSAAHPNSRFTVYTKDVPNRHAQWDSPTGVPISAYIWGCRRPDAYPLVLESPSWTQGVVLAAAMRTQTGAGAENKGADLVHDPMSMRPFMSYNFATYIKHWLSMEKSGRKMPKLFHVNWYQQGSDGNLLWPGYGENIRVIDWILKRCQTPEKEEAVTTAIGLMPKSLNTEGLTVDLAQLLNVDKKFWTKELTEMNTFFVSEMTEEYPPVVIDVVKKLKGNVARLA